MEVKDLNTWEEFEDSIVGLRTGGQRDTSAILPGTSEVLFRGQAGASWKLLTTLERRFPECRGLSTYNRMMMRCCPQVEAFMGRKFSLCGPDEYKAWATDYDSSITFRGEFKHYDLMAYLRHHGFPSPLLDWSRSPYVAAFFAFRDDRGDSDRVAIFAYCEDVGHGKGSSSSRPQIAALGQFVATHARHFLQQCQYTICTRWTVDNPTYFPNFHGWEYAPHEDVFSEDRPVKQDKLWKFTLPRSERSRVLARLNEFNLNAFSLFNSEDTLLETIAAREAHELELRR